MSRIADYEQTSRVTAADALHDKVEVTLGTWIIGAGPRAEMASDMFNEFIEHLTIPGENERLLPEQLDGYGLIFSRDTGNRRNYRRAKFRKTTQRIGGRDIPSLLPNGFLEAKLRTSGSRAQTGLPVIIEFDGEVKLNSTTYMRQARMRPRRSPQLGPRSDIFALEFPHEVRREYSLDGKNNWLHRNSRDVVEWTSEQAVSAPCHFVAAIQERFAFELQRTIEAVRRIYGHPLALLSPEPENSVKQIETYFEFFHSAPLQFVESMEAAALAYSRSVDVAYFSTGVDGNSKRLLIELFKGIYLRIYAKTNHRVRFEIQHNFKEMNRLSDVETSFADEADFRLILEAVRNDAASLVNAFLGSLNPAPVHESQQRAPLLFVLEVSRAARTYDKAQELLNCLCSNGRIDLSSVPSLRSAVLLLRERGVLQSNRRSTIYTVTRQWQSALQTLSEQTRLEAIAFHPTAVRLRAIQRAHAQ